MAVKRAGKTDLQFNDETKINALRREAYALLTLPPHPYIVESYIVDRIKGDYHIFMEDVIGGNLESLIDRDLQSGSMRNWTDLYPLIYQLAIGLDFLHSNGIIHRT